MKPVSRPWSPAKPRPTHPPVNLLSHLIDLWKLQILPPAASACCNCSPIGQSSASRWLGAFIRQCSSYRHCFTERPPFVTPVEGHGLSCPMMSLGHVPSR